MGEIKYRAWVKKNNCFLPVFDIDLHAKMVGVWGCGKEDCGLCDDYLRFDEVELVEYTGIKDKNNLEIYEGDIVRCFTHSLSKVEVKKGCFGLTSNGLHEPYFTPFTDVYGYCEILGNIYENPELLEENK